MIDMLKQHLVDKGLLGGELHPIIAAIADSIANNSINYRMKITIATSELLLFTSHFRRNIKHWNGSAIPINAISFSIGASGSGKDSSVNAARKCFSTGYAILDHKREEKAHQLAKAAAMREGIADPGMWDNYKQFYREPNPLFAAPSTPEGFIQHLNDLDTEGLGGGFIYSG